MSLSKFELQIQKTGFALEHSVSQQLRKKGWTVISNKYYIDDNEQTVREIDLIAYKARPVQHFKVYTTLVISCKKSEANAWALLSREIDLRDPNRDWHPLHAWSNDKALKHQITQTDFTVKHHERAKGKNISVLAGPTMDVFAFQEMNKQSGAPQNDKAIFSAITSLMKAQSYELNALPARKKDICLYQFSLLSVVDTDLLRIEFKDSELNSSIIDSEMYIANYIIKKQEDSSRIHFINYSSLDQVISEYDGLHQFNCDAFSDYCDNFYVDVVKDWKRAKILIEDFIKIVSWRLHWAVFKEFNARLEAETKALTLDWRPEKNSLAICLDAETRYLEFLNKHEESIALVRKALKTVYRYDGVFFFDEEDIPF